MPALIRREALDLSDAIPETARLAIREELEQDGRATRRVYAALARKVWSLLVERRFDPEIRDWLALLQNVKARLELDDEAAAERLTALVDLMRESVNLAEISPARSTAERPRARAILERLDRANGFLRRRHLLEDIGIKSAHLSNVLTQLLAHDLVVRRDVGKEAEYQITPLGRELIGGDQAAVRTQSEELPVDRRIAWLFKAKTSDKRARMIDPIDLANYVHLPGGRIIDDLAQPKTKRWHEQGSINFDDIGQSNILMLDRDYGRLTLPRV
ncbi:hypothetical protein [Sphingomonas hankyongi]|uniref:HTH marR-type domain-containing protein n=1 Tax=Sphingomonas hankyongi TaxID=2908209 RepID=A0ABT0S070_9SPHN|nr:hypothetical protein [Sphingomonas hankyongi]MCL6729192.1 hypothetical protein [Sphingomonas hankyongi]